MSPDISSIKLGPTLCLQCGHAFVPGAPEPSWCPGCGRLCSTFDLEEEPAPEPLESPEQRRTWWVWFWTMFAAGPLGALFIGFASRPLLAVAPAWLKNLDVLWIATGPAGVGCALLCGGLGAAYCASRLQRGQIGEDARVFAVLIGLLLLVAYFVLCGFMIGALLNAFR